MAVHLAIWVAFIVVMTLLRNGAFGKPIIVVTMIGWMLTLATLMTALERVLVAKAEVGSCRQCGYNLTLPV